MNEIKNNKEKSLIIKLAKWFKKPGVIVGSILVLIIAGYFSIPLFKQYESPFTTYKPLDIDSTLLKLDTFPSKRISKKITPPDSISARDSSSIINAKIIDTATVNDSSIKVDLLKLNTSYDDLDPNEQLNNAKGDIFQDDLFSQLILKNLSATESSFVSKLQFDYDFKNVVNILSATAVQILVGERMQYHHEILNAIEGSSNIKGILIVDINGRITYSTNRKLRNELMVNIYSELIIDTQKLLIQEIENDKIISLPVHHHYGKIGLIYLILEE